MNFPVVVSLGGKASSVMISKRIVRMSKSCLHKMVAAIASEEVRLLEKAKAMRLMNELKCLLLGKY